MRISNWLLTLIVTLALNIPFQQTTNAQDVTADLLSRINGLRQSLGVHQYAYSSILSAAANNQAEWMVSTAGDAITHTQPNGSNPRSRAASFGYPSNAVSENIYMGLNGTAESAWNWWMNSPIHYQGITNTAYTEVGIGYAVGQNGQAFVLMFGNPNGWGVLPGSLDTDTASNTTSNTTNDTSETANNTQPDISFVVGTDENGNIMHEVQPGDTLGQVAIRYGYGWDDVEYIRQLNNMTEADERNMKVGDIILIPPYDSTVTPTPSDPPPTQAIQVTPGPTENAIVLRSDALEFQTESPGNADDLGILPTASVSPSPTESGGPTATNTPHQTRTPAWVMVTITPQEVAQASTNDDGMQNTTFASSQAKKIADQQRIPSWLIGIIAVQGIVILGAGFELIRRRRG